MEFLFCIVLKIYNFNVLEMIFVIELFFIVDVEVMEVLEEVLVRICGVVVYLVDD